MLEAVLLTLCGAIIGAWFIINLLDTIMSQRLSSGMVLSIVAVVLLVVGIAWEEIIAMSLFSILTMYSVHIIIGTLVYFLIGAAYSYVYKLSIEIKHQQEAIKSDYIKFSANPKNANATFDMFYDKSSTIASVKMYFDGKLYMIFWPICLAYDVIFVHIFGVGRIIAKSVSRIADNLHRRIVISMITERNENDDKDKS